MADGKKNDDIKTIKNPLLSQSLLLEELSPVSFLVPAPTQKTQSVETYGSKTGVDVTLLGEKKQGSQVTQERGGVNDVLPSSQSFTEIPLNVSDSKINPNEPTPLKTDGEAGQSKSSSSFLPLLVPTASLNALNAVKEGITSTFSRGVQLGLKRQSSPQSFEPQLVPPTSESTLNSVTLVPEAEAQFRSDFRNSLSPTDPTNQIKPPVKSEPPKLPLPPPPLNQNSAQLKNPYALRNIHNTVSGVSRLSKSPPISLGTSESIPLYNPTNVPNLSSNFFSLLSGPQVGTTETFQAADHTTTVAPTQSTGLNQDLNIQRIVPELKPFTQFQNLEQKPSVPSPFTIFNPNIVSPQNTYPASTALPHIPPKTIYPSKATENNFFQPLLIDSQKTIPELQTCTNNQDKIPELKPSDTATNVVHTNIFSSPSPGNQQIQQTVMPTPTNETHNKILESSDSLPNVSLNTTVYSTQTASAPPVIQQYQTIPTLTPHTENQSSVPKLPIPTYDSFAAEPISKIFPESNVQPVPLIPVTDNNLPSSSEFQNKLFQGTDKNVENQCDQNQLSEIGKSPLSTCEIKKSDGIPTPSLTSFNLSSPFKSEEIPLNSIGLQSKQVTLNNKPVQEIQSIETNFVGNNTIPLQPTSTAQVPNIPSLSAFFTAPQINNQATNDTLHSVFNQPEIHPYSPPQSAPDPLPPSTFFQQTQSAPVSWNKQITDSAQDALTHTHFENLSLIHNTENISQSFPETSATNANSGTTIVPNIKPQIPNPPVITSDPVIMSTPSLYTYSSPDAVKPNYPIPSLYPQPLYTCPKLNPDSSTYPITNQQTGQPFCPVPAYSEKPDPTPVNPLVPTFNYFSLSQTSCLPPSLDQPVETSIATSKTPPSSYYFKPIQKPDVVTSPFLSHSSVPTNIESPHQVLNPTPSAPPKTLLNFPPPNVYYPKEIPSALKQQTAHTEVAPVLANIDNQNCVDGEELDQIPLEGSAVPLFNPETINRKKKVDVSAGGNTFRLSGGIKRRTYAPVPDLGVTERKNFISPASPSGMSASSQEEMAAIHENQNQNAIISRTPPGKTPESPMTVDTYQGNVSHGILYRPPYHHWFYKCGRDKKSPWAPFSMADSLNLEQVFTSSDLQEDTKVATDGGRYDVEILRRKKMSVYWDETDGEVRRCSWFVKSISDSRYIPYDENIAALLEDEYKQGCDTNEWNRKVELADGEVIILHGPSAIAHHIRSSSPDAWGSQPPLQQKPRVVKRGVEDFDIPKGEPKQVDHLLLVVHGIGKACDLRFRSLVEVVDDFRSISLQLVQSHFHSGVENGNVGRVEVLPVEWHKALHTETIDDRLTAITLPSIPRAREFTNETLLDILFYTSPVFCEKIVQAVGAELNRVFALYQKRNPGFRGQVSLGGHSLGSLILFDMLCHQRPIAKPHISSTHASLSEDDEDLDEVGFLMRKAKLSRRMSYVTIGPGTGQPYTIYPQLLFQPKAFFAMGSPIGMFVTVRGIETLGEDFTFPTCPAFFNIFHPNDPVAYRIEALIKPEMAKVPAVLIPHHKGRKRMHLELKETMAHVTAALKQKLVDSMRNTWNAVYQLAMFNRKDHSLQGEVNKVIEDEVLREASYLESDPPLGIIGEEGMGSEVRVGKLNDGRRIDYVLQEAPLETFNQYISAIRSHLVYWESEDTMLMMLKEIYGQMGITPDSQVPQPILPFDISGESDTYSEYTYSIGAPPTQFVRK